MSSEPNLSTTQLSLSVESARLVSLLSRMQVAHLYLKETCTRLEEVMWGVSVTNPKAALQSKQSVRQMNLNRVIGFSKVLNDSAEVHMRQFEQEGIPLLIDAILALEESISPEVPIDLSRGTRSPRMTDSLQSMPKARSIGIKSNATVVSNKLLNTPLAYLDLGENRETGLYFAKPVEANSQTMKAFSIVQYDRDPVPAINFSLGHSDGSLMHFSLFGQNTQLILTNLSKNKSLQGHNPQTMRLTVCSNQDSDRSSSFKSLLETELVTSPNERKHHH